MRSRSARPDVMKVSKWHGRAAADVAPIGTLSRRGKGKPANSNVAAEVTHYILIDGDTYSRLEAIASTRKLTARARGAAVRSWRAKAARAARRAR